jgi:hypothetical protein
MPRTPMRIALVATLLALPVLTRAQDATTTTTTAAPATTTTVPPPVKQTTEVQGNVQVDALIGRWLVVAAVKTPDGKVKPAPRVWEIRKGGQQVEMVLEHDAFPQRVNEEVNAAGLKGVAWTPDEEDLREIADRPASDEAPPPDYRAIDVKIMGPDAYPPELQEDEVTKGSKFAISVVESFSGRQGVIKNYATYAVREDTPTTLGGTFVNTTLAAAPLPIPITLKGDFKAYKLGPPRPRSWLQRLFSGCQRG